MLCHRLTEPTGPEHDGRTVPTQKFGRQSRALWTKHFSGMYMAGMICGHCGVVAPTERAMLTGLAGVTGLQQKRTYQGTLKNKNEE